MDVNQKISAADVISKLKDDGDFDRLRLKIVRQLKQNEGLRNSIISVVKQSAALNCPGAENMKPRQLCDAIHEEIREKAMNQISDGLWEIIRSGEGMKTEITETVQSVYDKLLNPQRKADIASTSSIGEVLGEGATELNSSIMARGESNGIKSDGELKEAPGFSQHNHTVANNHDSISSAETQQPSPGRKWSTEQGPGTHRGDGPLQTNVDSSPPADDTTLSGKRKRACDTNDEDPDIPPGFG